MVIPGQSVSCNRLLNPERYCQLMRAELVRLLVTRDHSLDSLFLIACRHLTETNSERPEEKGRYMQLALQYKVSCLKSLNKSISSEIENASIISDSTFATAMMLASDEVSASQYHLKYGPKALIPLKFKLSLGDYSMARNHISGILRMAQHNGGPQNLGCNGFMRHLLYVLWRDVHTFARIQMPKRQTLVNPSCI